MPQCQPGQLPGQRRAGMPMVDEDLQTGGRHADDRCADPQGEIPGDVGFRLREGKSFAPGPWPVPKALKTPPAPPVAAKYLRLRHALANLGNLGECLSKLHNLLQCSHCHPRGDGHDCTNYFAMQSIAQHTLRSMPLCLVLACYCQPILPNQNMQLPVSALAVFAWKGRQAGFIAPKQACVLKSTVCVQ